jgi:GNAT superfamily N-acetyltransferase
VVVRNVHGVVVGTAQIEQAASANGQHRAEVMKVLVHPDVQRQGVGTLLMHSIDAFARTRGWRLLILDTKLGDGGEQLYVRCGWIKFGEVPDYAYSPDGTLAGTSFWYKLLT